MPLQLHRIAFYRQLGKLFFEFCEALFRRFVVFFCKRLLFDGKLHDLPFDLIEFGRLAFDFHFEAAHRFVYKVDRFVGHKSIRDIAVAEHRRSDERFIVNPHAVMNFVFFAQAAQDRNRVFDRRFRAIDGLKSPLERRILFDVFPIFVKRRRSDRAKLSAREHRF